MKFKSFLSKKKLTLALHKPYNKFTDEGRSLERRRRIALTALTSTILRVLTMAIPLITLKITLNYLNAEIYGLWSAVTTVFALFAFTDLGLGNGLQTKLSQANGKDNIDLCRKIITNTYALLLVIAFLLLIIFVLLYPFVDWASLMNAQSSETIVLAGSVVFVIVLPKILSIPITIIQRTQLALQEGYKSDIWSIIGVLINLVIIVVIAKLDLGKITLLAFTSFLPVVISLINLFVYFYFQRKELKFSFNLFDFKMAKSLLSLGIFFSILSVLTTIGLSMDTFIVAKTCSLTEAGSYSIIYRVSAIFSAVVTILSAPLWGANGEAMARGDFQWVRNNTKKMSIIMVSISSVIVIVVLFFAEYFFEIWLGENFKFSFTVLFWLAIMQILLSFISPYFMILNAAGMIKTQIILFAVYTPISFVLKYYLSMTFGASIIPLIGSVTYFLFIVLGVYYFANKKLSSYKQVIEN